MNRPEQAKWLVLSQLASEDEWVPLQITLVDGSERMMVRHVVWALPVQCSILRKLGIVPS